MSERIDVSSIALSDMESKQILHDYYKLNSRTITIPSRGEHYLHDFTVDSEETLDLHVQVTTDQAGINNSLWIRLYKCRAGSSTKDCVRKENRVAISVDDSDYKTDDNASVALIYKTKLGE